MFHVLPTKRSERMRLFALLALFAVLALFFHKQALDLIGRLPMVYAYCRYSPQEGDVVFQSLPHGDLVDAIEGITHSRWSHCGVVLKNDKGQWLVIESIFNVHETPLLLWMVRCRDGNFAAYRLDSKFDPQIPGFKQHLLTFMGQPYDYDYDMAKGHGVYCSGLVYTAFDETCGEKMGVLQKLGDLDWQPYRAFIRSEAQGALPLDRAMITPAALAQAPQLHQVYPQISVQ
jgi:hypothetical protein